MMNLKKLLLFVSLFPGPSNALKDPRSFAVSPVNSSSNNNKKGFVALDLRGGAGPLPVEATAKVAAGVCMAQAMFMYLAPKKNAEAFKIKPTPVMEWVFELNAGNWLGFSTAAVMLFFDNASAYKAIGAAIFIAGLGSLKAILNDTPKELGLPDATAGQWISIAMCTFLSHSLWTNASYADKVLKFMGVWFTLNGSLFMFAPGPLAGAWGVDTSKEKTVLPWQILGCNLAALGILSGSLAAGFTPAEAFGHALVAPLVNCIKGGFVDKSWPDMGPIYAWIVMSVIWIATLSL